jgi:hypothetical protein
MNKKNQLLLGAAVIGMLSATAVPHAFAADKAPAGKCMSANACKGKSGCKTDANECKGKNACKGKGFLKTSEVKCNKMAKKNDKIHWEAPADAPAAS